MLLLRRAKGGRSSLQPATSGPFDRQEALVTPKIALCVKRIPHKAGFFPTRRALSEGAVDPNMCPRTCGRARVEGVSFSPPVR